MRFAPHFLSALTLTLVLGTAAFANPDETGAGTGVGLISSSSNAVGGPFFGLNINNLVGANRFYAEGYTGSRAVVSSIEAGHVWNGHETLTDSTVRLNASGFGGTQLGQYDRHATWVGQTIAGRPVSGQYYQRGIAHGATLWSGAIATQWSGTPFTTGFGWSNGNAFTNPYAQSLLTGVDGRVADVVNGSWGFQNATGNDVFTLTADGMARQSRRTMVWSAGNSGPTSNTVGAPGAGYNAITVGALGADTDATPYRTVSTFSSRGPVDYQDPVTGFVAGGRARVDITAPGQNLTLAFYGGTTGGNQGGIDDASGATNFYSFQTAGTSFAAPIVSGGAALLCDVGYDRFGGGSSIDATVIKSVLLNSADKTAVWNNGQTVVGGVVQTTQGLDHALGAGIMNLDQAFDQYTAGTTDVFGIGSGNLGFVEEVGWDLGRITDAFTTNDYYFADPLLGGSTFTATLNWMANRRYVGTAAGGAITATNLGLTDLNLQLWSTVGGVPASLIAQSASLYNNTEHFSFLLPNTGAYMLRVVWAGERFDLANNGAEDYGIAWAGVSAPVVAVPEAGSVWLIGAGAVLGGILLPRRRAKSAG